MTNEQLAILVALLCVSVATGWFMAETLDAVVDALMKRRSK